MDVAGLVEIALLVLLVAGALQPRSLELTAFSLLLLANVDVAAASVANSGLVGSITFVKGLLVPGLLLFRWLRSGEMRRHMLEFTRSPSALLWFGVTGLVAAGVLRSPFPIDGLKMVGALVSHTLAWAVFALLIARGRPSNRTIAGVLWATLGLAALQTLALGNVFGLAAASASIRVSSFASPQSFAEFLGVLILILVWREGLRRPILMLAVLAALLLSGSRLGFVGATLGLLMWWWLTLNLQRLVLALGALLILVAALPLGLGSQILQSRLGEVVNAVNDPGTSVIQSVGTFRWRAGMYAALNDAMLASTPVEWVLGHGTSSAGLVGQEYDARFFGPGSSWNRVVHSEPLRLLYEGGVLAFAFATALFLTLLAVLARGLLPPGRTSAAARASYGAVLSALPLLLLSLFFENILQAAASPGVIAFLFLFAGLTARAPYEVRRAPASTPLLGSERV